MKKTTSVAASILLLMFSLIVYSGCNAVRSVTQALTDLKRLEFKLNNVSGFRLAGVDLSSKRSLSDFSAMEGLTLLQAFNAKKLNADFILNVGARNPNTGTNGTRNESATLKALDWRLLIDDKETVTGGLDAPLQIPGSGQETIIPLRVSLDLFKFFGDQGYNGVINLALAIGGFQSNISRVKLDAKPTVAVPGIGDMAYPGRITIVDKEYRDK